MIKESPNTGCHMIRRYSVAVLLIVIAAQTSYACTSIIVSGKLTKDGRPLLLKHRDAGGDAGVIVNLSGAKYEMLALVPRANDKRNVLCGTNSAQLSIVNTATYNLGKRKINGVSPTKIMYEALGKCSSLQEFEILLDDYQKKDSLVPANFGLIDMNGGAAYYEVSYKRWVKYDVNDSNTAPLGYLVYANFSFSGDSSNKRGYVRYMTAYNIINEAIQSGIQIEPRWIVDNISRSLRNDYMGIDWSNTISQIPNASFPDQDLIPNRYSSSSIVFQGPTPNKDECTIAWIVLGNPLVSPVIPVSIQSKIPVEVFTDIKELSNTVKGKVYINEYDNDKYYIRYDYLFNRTNTGVMQRIRLLEEELLLRNSPLQGARFIIDRYLSEFSNFIN